MIKHVWAFSAVVLLARIAEGSEANPWQVDLRGSHVVLGGERETGGFMPVLAAQKSFEVAKDLRLGIGGDVGLFGLGGAPRWIGFLAGPTGSISYQASKAIGLGARLSSGLGRIPVCNDWGLCLRYWGLFPSFAATGTYTPRDNISFELSMAGRYVNTLAWSGASWEPSLGARFSW